MGMDATATIWVGFRTEDFDACDEDASLHPDLKALFQADEEDEEYIDEIALNDGLTFELIHVSEEIAGGGVIVLRHDWDYGAQAFDLADLTKKISDVLPVVKAKFEEWNFEAPLGVWIQTDFS